MINSDSGNRAIPNDIFIWPSIVTHSPSLRWEIGRIRHYKESRLNMLKEPCMHRVNLSTVLRNPVKEMKQSGLLLSEP